jgi:hypothetical protein
LNDAILETKFSTRVDALYVGVENLIGAYFAKPSKASRCPITGNKLANVPVAPSIRVPIGATNGTPGHFPNSCSRKLLIRIKYIWLSDL